MKISFCTSVRNRLDHIRQTLPVNLAEVRIHNAEILVLDYGSTDGLEKWIVSEFTSELHSRKLRYYRFDNTDHFDRSHSKNLALRLSEGDLFCNIDADNFIGRGFCSFINTLFTAQNNVFLTGWSNLHNRADCYGKVCVPRTKLLSIGGYDENFEGHGFEDVDLVNRLELIGLSKITLNQPQFLVAIPHDNQLRIREDKLTALAERVLRGEESSTGTPLMLLLKNSMYLSCRVIEKPQTSEIARSFRFQLFPNSTSAGRWHESASSLMIEHSTALFRKVVQKERVVYIQDGQVYEQVIADEQPDMLLFFMQIFNRYRTVNNCKQRITNPNETFGRGEVREPGNATSISF